jgi:hypothetical protein
MQVIDELSFFAFVGSACRAELVIGLRNPWTASGFSLSIVEIPPRMILSVKQYGFQSKRLSV